MNTITFRTAGQAAIFECELKGQFSDGHWENSSNQNWPVWTEAKVMVGSAVGRNFEGRGYNIVNQELIDIVGDRMIFIAKCGLLGFNFSEINSLEQTLFNWGKMDLVYNFDIPDYVKGEQRIFLVNVLNNGFQEKYNSLKYTHDDLMKDLREMQRTMRYIKGSNRVLGEQCEW